MKFTFVLCFALVGVLAIPCFSQTLLEENFDDAINRDVVLNNHDTGEAITNPAEFFTYEPEGWTITASIRDEADSFSDTFPFPCWVAMDWFEWGFIGSTREEEVPGFDLGIMVTDSDAFGSLGYATWLTSPIVDVAAPYITIEFDNHYRHNDNQIATMQVTWDGGSTYSDVFMWDDSNRNDNEVYISQEIHTLEKPTDATSVGLRFRYYGSSSQDGFADFDWYWAFDNVTITATEEISQIQTPTLSVAPENPSGLDNISLVGSSFTAQGLAQAESNWEIALDENFSQIVFSSQEDTNNLTSIEVPNHNLPIDQTLYARVQYVGEGNITSNYSEAISFTLSPPPGLRLIFSENFEDTPEGELPPDWSEVNFTEPGGTEGLGTWAVHTQADLASIGSNRVNVPGIVDGKSCYADSDGYGDQYYEAHLFTPEVDLSGVTNVILTFNSNYMQNQDNIGVLEYTVDGGDFDDTGNITGTWLPIAYLLDTEDITFDDQGNPDPVATFDFSNIADGTPFAYVEYVFASLTTPVEELGPYISPRHDDNSTESKRFEKYRLPEADNQSSVRIRWMNMGTFSWFWGVDNVQIWGDDGTDVLNWSLY